jgi:dihydrofolate reductase/thymidylate synthase
MSLVRFNIIVAIDSGNGVAKEGGIPWYSKEDMKFFRDTTIGKRKNAVIMGRVTYESIPSEYRPLEGRLCVIISRTWKQEEHPDIQVYPSLVEALAGLGNSGNYSDNGAEVFIAGGEQIYKEAIRDYSYLCRRIYVTRFKMDYGCDMHFPFDDIKNMPQANEPVKTRDYVRYSFMPKVGHDEYAYLDLLADVKENGDPKPDRTGVGTRSLFGKRLEFDISERLPIFTTKKVNYEAIVKELLFFISGKTDSKILEDQNVKIWKGNTSKKAIEGLNLPYREGDIGPMYGHQWRHWGAEYTDCDASYDGKGSDQLLNIIDGIRKDPHSRRHVLSTWNVQDLDKGVLYPCHVLAQFNVSSDRKNLDCQVYCRSQDLFLGTPFNITSYCLLTYMVAHICGLRPRKYVHVIGDAHIYNTHLNQVQTQLKRTPRPFPTLSFRSATKLQEIGNFSFDSFCVTNYTSWSAIMADMAV